MKFDRRNPFSAWGFEQEVYTMNGENETIKLERPGFETMRSMEDDVFVNGGNTTTVTEFTKEPKEAFFTNNENMVEPALIRRRAGMVNEEGERVDIENAVAKNYNNAELNYYGIEAQDYIDDTKAHANEETSEEGGDNNSSNGEEEENPDAPGVDNDPEHVCGEDCDMENCDCPKEEEQEQDTENNQQ